MVLILIYIVVFVFIAYWGVGTILYFMQPKLLYHPVQGVPYTPAELDLEFEDVFFESSDGLKLNGWFIPAEDSKFTVLFCHGNGGNIMHRLDSINVFNNLGLNCFIFDYRGYGQSQGKPSENGTYEDAAAAQRWLTEHKHISADKIIFFGRSLGASVAAHLAARVPAAGLVLESAFTSFVNMGKKFYPYLPVRLFARFKYNTAEYLKQVRCPVMVIHSRDDELVPFEFGERLYEAANEPKEFVQISGGHNDGFFVSGEAYRNAWRKWLNSVKNHVVGTDAHQPS